MTAGYDTKPDLDAYYGAMADGVLGYADPGEVYDLVDRVSSRPEQAARSLRFPPDTPGDVIRENLLGGFYRAYASYGLPEPQVGDRLAGRMQAVAARIGVPLGDVASAFEEGGPAMDRMLETYYRS